jgi:hypothetical protein
MIHHHRQIQSMAPIPQTNDPFSSSTTLSSSTSAPQISQTDKSHALLSPRTLYAQSFHRPSSSQGITAGRYRKDMREMTGYGPTEDEYDALPIAVRRKVRSQSPPFCFISPPHGLACPPLLASCPRRGNSDAPRLLSPNYEVAAAPSSSSLRSLPCHNGR